MAVDKWARTQAEEFIRPLARRWRHLEGVVDRARAIARLLPGDDGDAPALGVVGFHPLDGARFVAGRGHERLAALVAHHTGARYEAALRGLGDQLGEFVDEHSAVSAALAYCWAAFSAIGRRVTPSTVVPGQPQSEEDSGKHVSRDVFERERVRSPESL